MAYVRFQPRRGHSIVPAIVKKHGGRLVGRHAIALMCFTCVLGSSSARARPQDDRTEHVGPAIFGRVFKENRASLVQVTGRPHEGSARPAWSTGFVIGARGEVVFGAQTSPRETL